MSDACLVLVVDQYGRTLQSYIVAGEQQFDFPIKSVETRYPTSGNSETTITVPTRLVRKVDAGD